MTRPAPAASRTLAILDFLAARPTEAFTLSELARELGINLASAHALLGAMTDAGYLVRHPTHKTYRLGPSTMAVGHAALVSHPVIGVARQEMQRLADETGLECTASAPLETALVAVARVSPSTTPRPPRPLISVGQRLPLVPPLGIMFLAWSSDERIERWLKHTAGKAHYRRVLSSARALGYNVGVTVRGEYSVVPPRKGDPSLLDLDPAQRYQVDFIASSTFDELGQVSLVINVAGFNRRLTPPEIEGYGLRLRATTTFITDSVHGRPPAYQQRSA
jgi:DNA-binding IclR family transcriptional regulator